MSARIAGRVGAVSGGLLLLGGGSYVYLVTAARACHPDHYAGVSLNWVLSTTLGIGFFLPVELELARLLSGRTAQGLSPRAAVVASIRSALAGLLLLAGLCGLAALVLPAGALGRGALLPLVANLVAQAWAYLARGAAAGLQRFRLYGGQLALDGALRATGALGLALFHVQRAAPYNYLLALSTTLSAVVMVPTLAGTLDGGGIRGSFPGPGRNLRLLVGATMGSQLVANASPLLLQLSGAAAAASSALFASLVLARVPVFLFAALQAVFLPALAQARAHQDAPAFRRKVARAERLVLAGGLAASMLAAAVGRQVLELVYGNAYASAADTLVPLTIGTALFLWASLRGQVAIALERHRAVAAAWLLSGASCLALAGVATTPSRAAWAYALGSGLAAAQLLRATRPGIVRAALADSGATRGS